MNTGTKISESDPCKVFETFAQILRLEQFFLSQIVIVINQAMNYIVSSMNYIIQARCED